MRVSPSCEVGCWWCRYRLAGYRLPETQSAVTAVTACSAARTCMSAVLPAGGTYMITTSVNVRTKLLDADPLPVSAA